MNSKYSYASFANYSPRGKSDHSIKSQKLCGQIKAGNEFTSKSALKNFNTPNAQVLQQFLNPNVTLIPVPRSAPLAKNALWPAKVIADVLVSNGYGYETRVMLERISPLPKSSTVPGHVRPNIYEHKNSLKLNADMIELDEITLVDDVITKGSTTVACADLLAEHFIGVKIRVFAMFRTIGLPTQPEIEKVVDPFVGTIIGYESGKSCREDPQSRN